MSLDLHNLEGILIMWQRYLIIGGIQTGTKRHFLINCAVVYVFILYSVWVLIYIARSLSEHSIPLLSSNAFTCSLSEHSIPLLSSNAFTCSSSERSIPLLSSNAFTCSSPEHSIPLLSSNAFTSHVAHPSTVFLVFLAMPSQVM